MSVIKEAYASPARIQAVYRFLLHRDEQWEALDTLEGAISPDSLLRTEKRVMLRGVLKECERIGLIVAEGDRVGLHPDLPAEARNRKLGMRLLPSTLLHLFVTSGDENHPLLRMIAWYLAQPVDRVPGEWKPLERTLKTQVRDNAWVTSDPGYGQFNDWLCYLGFGWRHGSNSKELLVPDPTPYLRANLDRVFVNGEKRLTPSQAEGALARLCPVFEGGWARREVEEMIGGRAERTVSGSTARAWLRLEDEGLVQVEQRMDDSDVHLFPDGPRTIKCSALVRLQRSRRN